jgi:hypothetical protein
MPVANSGESGGQASGDPQRCRGPGTRPGTHEARCEKPAGLLGETARGVATEVIAKVIVHAGGMG